jgi:hypothetical protein
MSGDERPEGRAEVIPEVLRGLLDGRPAVGDREQAFPFLTVDEAGFPHVALLSRAEIRVGPDGREVLAVVASRRTRANLERDGRAGLVAVEGTTAHYAKLRVGRAIDAGGVLACAMSLTEYKADSLGIPLSPVSFVTTVEIARLEGWAASEELLQRLAEGAGRAAGQG